MPENQNAQQNFLAEMEVETANPYGEILNLVKSFGVDSKFIDFDILEIKTECKVVGESQPRQIAEEKNPSKKYILNTTAKLIFFPQTGLLH